MMRRSILVSVLAVVMALTAQVAGATPIIVNSGLGGFTSAGPGTGRAQGIQAVSGFSVSNIAIEGDLVSQSFDLVIYASTDGSNPGGVLASASAVRGGSGFGFNSIPLSFSFLAGNFYIVNWRPSVSNSDWVNNLQYYGDSGLPVVVGPIRLIDGIDGFNADRASNALHPSFAYDTGAAAVPEPASMVLIVSGLMGLALCRRARKTV